MSYGFGRINDLASKVHGCAVRHGFYGDEHANQEDFWLSRIALIAEELGEASHAIRDGDRDHLAEELADVVIRTLDFAAHLGINIEQAIVDKAWRNEEREYRHGRVKPQESPGE